MHVSDTRRRIAVSGDEVDVFSRYWRSRVCRHSRAGVTSEVKRRARRRERQQGKREAREDR